MKKLSTTLAILLTLSFSTSAYAFNNKTKENYKKYKRYSPEKKKRVKNKWSSFKKGSGWDGLSDSEKAELRRKVLQKKSN